MKNTIIVFTIMVLSMLACKQTGKKESTASKTLDSIAMAFAIEILDEKGSEIIDPNAQIEVMASGFTWTEGPLWIEDGKFLLFSDIPNNKVYKLDANGDTSTYLHPSGLSPKKFLGNEPGSNGLVLNPQGELVLMQHGDRKVAKMMAPLSQPVENYLTLIDNYQGKRLNSPNDGAFDKEGNLYFTDPAYGLPEMMNDPNKELSFQGIYCLLKSGDLVLLDSLSRPNGIALSPDGTNLYVAVSDSTNAAWHKYDIVAPGKVENKKEFYNLTHLVGVEGQQGLPDGLKTNKEGYLFATGAGGVWIFNPNGKPLARIYTGQLTANCALGYNEKRLFMTADDYILSVALK